MRNIRKIKAKRNLKVQTQKGITLLVLVVTIIVLLILAGITIGALTGENGIIKNARESKEQTEISNEKEILEKATVEAMGKNKYGNIEESELQSALNQETGDGKTEAVDVGEEFEVLFKESNRYYIVDKDGNVGEANEYYKDENPGDIIIGENGEKLDGKTEETAYQIWCIEDLVEWSQNYAKYQDAYIELRRTLNFKSRLSYTNGKILNCNSIEELKDLLTNTSGSGFTPINNFKGTFDGKDFEIQNIYENISGNAGLFARVTGTIKNLKISGNIISSNSYAGGIAGIGEDNLYISGCKNYCNIIATSEIENANGSNYGSAGGIVGRCGYGVIINNCANIGDINAIHGGGIIGYEYAATEIICINSYNKGIIKSSNTAGGIIALTTAGAINIYNCYNVGEINGSNAGGIMGYKYHTTNAEIKNCYNYSKVKGESCQGDIIGYNWAFDTSSSPTIENVFFTNQLIGAFGNNSSNVIGTPVYCEDISNDDIVKQLNNYVDSITNQDITWRYWTFGTEGYPLFQ
mgnify:CR=1 FL=1